MGAVVTFPTPPLAAVARFAELLLNKHSPHEIAEAVEIMIDVLDMIGGDYDADAEEDDMAEDDDPAGQCDEDGINTDFAMIRGSGAGCPIADPDSEHDGREEECAP